MQGALCSDILRLVATKTTNSRSYAPWCDQDLGEIEGYRMNRTFLQLSLEKGLLEEFPEIIILKYTYNLKYLAVAPL